MSEEQDDKIYPSPLQIFVLAYLYSEELKLKEKDMYLDNFRLATHHSQSDVLPYPVSISIKELVTIIPSSLVEKGLSSEEVHNQLNVLEENGYLESKKRWYTTEYASFSITSDGILTVKKIFANLSSSMKQKEVYDKNIDNAEGSNAAKNWLKGLWDNLKDKAQDEIADEILSGVKTYGPPLITMLIQLAKPS